MSRYTKAKNFIRKTTSRETLYDDIRQILKQDILDPIEDWQIKELQRLADAKYKELGDDK